MEEMTKLSQQKKNSDQLPCENEITDLLKDTFA